MPRLGFNVMGLDEAYEVVALMRCTNIQWNRKYFESGTFSVQIPLTQYDDRIVYIYTKDRPEMGKIDQVNYNITQGSGFVQLSGYFLEKQVDRMSVYPPGQGNIIESPQWTEATGPAEDVAFYFFDAFKSMNVNVNGQTIHSELDITREDTKHQGSDVTFVREEGGKLGEIMYSILKQADLSYRVSYDFLESTKKVSVWKGLDRTEGNTEGNNPIVFSTKFGNVKDPSILIDRTSDRNAVIINNSYQNDKQATIVQNLVKFKVNRPTNTDDNFEYMTSTVNRSDYASLELYQEALEQEAYNRLYDYYTVINIEFDTMEGSHEYMKDFDLGDLCSIDIAELNISAEARLIGCYEVIKGGTWKLTMEFGTPIIR